MPFILKLRARSCDSRNTHCIGRWRTKAAHTTCIPPPTDIDLRIPPHLMAARFRRGFHHALNGGQITPVEQLRLSFREGYRAGKLYLKELRRGRGIVEFPLVGRIRMRARP